MRKKKILKKIGAFILCGCMFLGGMGVTPEWNVSAEEYGKYAPEEEVIASDAEQENVDSYETDIKNKLTGENNEDVELLGASYYNSNYAFQVLNLVNQQRAANGLPALKMDAELYNTAKVRAEEISRVFDHTRPDGTECYTAFPSGQGWVGENIAAGYASPSAVMNGWMNSTGHRENILRSQFKSVGIACFYIPNSKYGYYWVQCFGDTVKKELKEDGSAISTTPPTSAPVATNYASNVMIGYRTHVQSIGWQDVVFRGATSGTLGLSKRLESIQIAVSGDDNLGIRYRTHVQSYGWQGWKYDGEVSGTYGEAKRLEAIAIELTGSSASKYDVYYRVHAQSYGWLGWAKNGECAGTAGQAKRLEAIQVIIVNKGTVPNNGTVGYSYIELGKSANNNNMSGQVNYMTHVQTYGNQSYVYDGSISGTTGEAKRLEGIRINLNNSKTGVSGGITYSTHVQKYGWLDWSSNGEFNGTSGEAKRLEAIKIQLTGDVANKYDVYYRVHAQTYGWLGWAKNGEPSGTAGYAKRLEGIQIVLVPKGAGAPSNAMQSQSAAYIAK